MNTCTFDSINELEKIKKYHPKCQCILKISSEQDDKFGVRMGEVREMLVKAKMLGLKVVGFSFNVGDCNVGGASFEAYKKCLEDIKKCLQIGNEVGIGEELELIDIGDGFSMLGDPHSENTFIDVAPKISDLVDKLFPDPRTRIISSPGKYICESVAYSCAPIIGSKIMKDG